MRKDADTTQSRTIRIGLQTAGTILVTIAIIGIIIPILPTTPLLLLAAACYAKSSKRLYNWLLYNKWFGRYIKNWYEGRDISTRTKALTITFLVLTIGYSTLFVVPGNFGKAVMVVIAIAVTVHILMIPTRQVEETIIVKQS